MKTRLTLIRHGITDWNIEGRYSGFTDVGLSETGRKQVIKLRKRLKKELFHKVYCSDRRRAIQTARIIFKKERIEFNPGLREIHFGIFEGLRYKEIKERYPGIYRKWIGDPYRLAIPKGERLSVFKKRVMRSLRQILAKNKGKSVAVVCHGGPISIYVNHILKARDFWKHIPHAASLTVVEFNGKRAKIIALNDTEHL